jgi:norsolorinic acid ketoreductase
LVKLDSAKEADATVAVQYLLSKHEIQKLDVVVANAGISAYFGKATVTPAKEMYEHFKINTVAPLLLFQATVSLLNSAETPRFIVISSGAGSLSGVENLPVENTAYGTSKAGVNFVTRRIHYENPVLIAFSVNPGWLQTDVSHYYYHCIP